MSMVIAVMGFAGAMTMSAIKRDRGVRDYGTLVEGHGGVLDRIDAICFAAPVFYHITRQILNAERKHELRRVRSRWMHRRNVVVPRDASYTLAADATDALGELAG